MTSLQEADKDTPLETLSLLESRLHKLEFFIDSRITTSQRSHLDEPLPHKAIAKPPTRDQTALARLHRLEDSLASLAAKSPVVADILELYRTHPDLFPPSTPHSSDGSSLTTAEKQAIVLSLAPLFPTTVSRLTSLSDTPLPSTQASAALIALVPRLAEVERRQEVQARKVEELKARSAAVLQRWYEVGVLGAGECWGEWEARVMDVERGVRGLEKARETDEVV